MRGALGMWILLRPSTLCGFPQSSLAGCCLRCLAAGRAGGGASGAGQARQGAGACTGGWGVGVVCRSSLIAALTLFGWIRLCLRQYTAVAGLRRVDVHRLSTSGAAAPPPSVVKRVV